ncbi:MAG: S8 family serine peptidase [Anaerolineae bacterium]
MVPATHIDSVRRASRTALAATLLVAVALSLLARAPAAAYEVRAAAACSDLRQTSTGGPYVAPAVAAAIAKGDDTISVIVTMRDQVASSVVVSGRRTQLRAVVAGLRQRAAASQKSLLAELNAAACPGCRVTPYWIFNGVAVTAPASVVQRLAARPDVLSITPDAAIPLADVQTTGAAPQASVEFVNAPAVWALGYTGTGILVANVDTGVDATHPDLAARWRSDGFGWYDATGEYSSVPHDSQGHGTWTMGVAVGGDSSGTVVGVAPGAIWMAARVFATSGNASVSAIHLAYQWLLDPDGNPATDDVPQVVNNSWGFQAPGTCNQEFVLDLQALRAAGVISVFAAGNTGPAAGTSVSPANYAGVISVGAIDGNDAVYAQGARGPSACGTGLFPMLAAPGVAIRAPSLGGSYSVATGTSLAAPHVTGALALLLDAFPGLPVADYEAALSQTTHDLGEAGPDTTFGYGRIDVLAAFQWLQAHVGVPTPTPVSTPTDQGPTVTAVSLAPRATRGDQPVAINAQADSGAGSVAAAEYSIDGAGVAGSGTAMAVSAGQPAATLSAQIGVATLEALASGMHSVFVRAQDGQGRWGPLAAADFYVDRAAPTVAGAAVMPATTNGIQSHPDTPGSLRLEALAEDADSEVSTVEAFIDVVAAPGSGYTFVAADSAFDSGSEVVWAPLPLSALTSLAEGEHLVYVVAADLAQRRSDAAVAAFAIDRTAPGQPVLTSTISTSDGRTDVSIRLSATDDETGVAEAEWFIDADPGEGMGAALPCADGACSGQAGEWAADGAVQDLSPGWHSLCVRARDEAGNWSPCALAAFEVTASAAADAPSVYLPLAFGAGRAR